MVWGIKNGRVLQGVIDSDCLPHRYTQVLAQTKHQQIQESVREAVLRNSGLVACAIQQAEVGEAVVAGDIQEAHRRAMQLSYANLRYEKANLAHERNSDKHSLDAVGILKKATDMEDKDWIVK